MNINYNTVLSWVEDRLSEPTTWRGLIGLAAAAGVTISPHNAAVILAAGMGIAGFVGVVTKDPKNVEADVQAAVTDIVLPVIEANANTAAVVSVQPAAAPTV
jgi:hypothetical protein